MSGPPRWGRDLGVRERAATGPICDDVPHGFASRNVVPLVPTDGGLRALEACLVEHQPAPAYFNTNNLWARIPLEEAFVDDRPAAPGRAATAS